MAKQQQAITKQEVIKILASAGDFTALMPSHEDTRGTLGQIMAGKSPLAKLTARLYDNEQFQLPLTPNEFNAKFPGTKRVFLIENDEECPGRQTNLSKGATVESPFLMNGFGILGTAEGQGFALPGVMKNNPEPATSPNTPCVTGCSEDLTEHNAVLAWGYPTWNIIEKFFQAYRVQMYIGRHFQIFEEAAHVMGLVGATMEFIGAGHSMISVMGFVRDTNDVLVAKECGKQFIPQNATTGSDCVPAPTADVIWGSQHTRGISNRCYPLPFPILWLPGMTLDVRFVQVEGDCCFLPAMRRDAVLDCANPTKPSSLYADPLACGVGNSAVFTVPGGCFTLGAVLAGWDITPLACIEYLAGVLPGTALELMYQNVGVGSYLASKLLNPANRNQLGGIPDELMEKIQRFTGGPSRQLGP